jgi:hypothetical protein
MTRGDRWRATFGLVGENLRRNFLVSIRIALNLAYCLRASSYEKTSRELPVGSDRLVHWLAIPKLQKMRFNDSFPPNSSFTSSPEALSLIVFFLLFGF